jgi:hypothetical protein
VFHGCPKPWDVLDTWVGEFYKIGGIAEPRFFSVLNASDELIKRNVEATCKAGYFVVNEFVPNENAKWGSLIIVAGGPSLSLTWRNIKPKVIDRVVAVNGAYKYLLDRGMRPDYVSILDAREESAQFLDVSEPRFAFNRASVFWLASQCHPQTFANASPGTIQVWHAWGAPVPSGTKTVFIGGGATVGLKTLALGFVKGWRKFELHGFDSSYLGEENHAYRQPLNDDEKMIDIVVFNGKEEKKFKCARWMAKQASDFQDQASLMVAEGCEITVHGFGLLPFLAQQMSLGSAE